MHHTLLAHVEYEVDDAEVGKESVFVLEDLVVWTRMDGGGWC